MQRARSEAIVGQVQAHEQGDLSKVLAQGQDLVVAQTPACYIDGFRGQTFSDEAGEWKLLEMDHIV